MLTTRTALLASILTLAASALAAADEPKESDLIKLLQSDTPAAEKALACKQLSIYGSPDAVPELAKLLSNEQLASWARIALEAIPGPASDEALRKAVPTLKGRLLTGVINSIGVRQDAAAVEALTAPLKDQDAEVASAAAVALGRIGNAAASKTLRQSLTGAPATVRSAIAEGCILCAERLLADGQPAEAAQIYDELRKADLPKQRKLEATRGSILARKAEGIPLLVEQLRSPDKPFFYLGLSTARELPGPEVASALAAEFVGAASDRAALLLYTLADRNDTAQLPAVLQATTSGPKPVRLAAIEVLPRLGNPSCVPPLLAIATADDEELAAAAKAALAKLPGEKIDADIKTRLASAQGKSLPVLIELVGLRRIDAKADLLKAADHPQAGVRGAALMALGETIVLDELGVLVSEVVKPKHPEDAQVAQLALKTACVRMPDADACAGQLASAMANAPVATKVTLLEIIGSMGGAKALEALGAAAKTGDPQLQDASTRALGEWLNVDAGPVLLDLAKTLTEDKYQVRALRGYIRLARQFATSDRQRIDMCRQALDLSKRTAEQKLIIEALARTNNIDALRIVVQAGSSSPELQADGLRVAQAIAQKLGDKPEVRDLLAKVKGEKGK